MVHDYMTLEYQYSALGELHRGVAVRLHRFSQKQSVKFIFVAIGT